MDPFELIKHNDRFAKPKFSSEQVTSFMRMELAGNAVKSLAAKPGSEIISSRESL